MVATAVISSKGQIVIPATLRRRYRLTEGTTVVFQEERGRLVLEPNDFSAILSLEGTLKDFPLERTLQEKRAKEEPKDSAKNDEKNEPIKEYFLDPNAVLRYFGVGKAQGGEKVGVLFKQAKDGQARLFIATVNLGEIFYILLKYVGEQ